MPEVKKSGPEMLGIETENFGNPSILAKISVRQTQVVVDK